MIFKVMYNPAATAETAAISHASTNKAVMASNMNEGSSSKPINGIKLLIILDLNINHSHNPNPNLSQLKPHLNHNLKPNPDD